MAESANNCSASVRVTVSEPPAQTAPDLVVGAPTVSDTLGFIEKELL